VFDHPIGFPLHTLVEARVRTRSWSSAHKTTAPDVCVQYWFRGEAVRHDGGTRPVEPASCRNYSRWPNPPTGLDRYRQLSRTAILTLGKPKLTETLRTPEQ